MSIEVEQRVIRLEVELQVVRETLQQAAQVQLHTNQTISELAVQINELTRNVNHFVTSSSKKQPNYLEKQNRSVNQKRNNQPNLPNRHSNGSYGGSGNYNNGGSNPKAMQEQLNFMMSRLDSLMNYLEQPGSD